MCGGLCFQFELHQAGNSCNHRCRLAGQRRMRPCQVILQRHGRMCDPLCTVLQASHLRMASLCRKPWLPVTQMMGGALSGACRTPRPAAKSPSTATTPSKLPRSSRWALARLLCTTRIMIPTTSLVAWQRICRHSLDLMFLGICWRTIYCVPLWPCQPVHVWLESGHMPLGQLTINPVMTSRGWGRMRRAYNAAHMFSAATV